jgi:RNA polymerase sigma-70 factor, ECF subfamily
MLGTVAEAEDAVQETYIRWYRMDQAERDEIVVPRAWLTRVASRICLDMLGTARPSQPVPPATAIRILISPSVRP